MRKVSTRANRPTPVRQVIISADAPTGTINPDQDTLSPVDASEAPHEATERVELTGADAPTVRSLADDAKVASNEKMLKDHKAVRYSFTVSSGEARLLEELRQTHQIGGTKLKKNVLLRAALLALSEVGSERLTQIVAQADEGLEGNAKRKKHKKDKGKK